MNRIATLPLWLALTSALAAQTGQEGQPSRPASGAQEEQEKEAAPQAEKPARPEAKQEAEPEHPTLKEQLMPEDPLRKEMVELFHKVERKLQEIDDKLGMAGIGDTLLEEVEDSGIDKLLDSTGGDSKSVVEDIDRILEIAQEMGATCLSSSMQSGDKPQSEGEPSPLDQERDTGPQGREKTPEAPQDKPGEKEGENPQPKDGEDPKSPLDNPEDGQNKPGSPQDHPSAPSENAEDAEAWGNLPVRFRQAFQNQGGSDMPTQYRDWIDSYYRRMNRRR